MEPKEIDRLRAQQRLVNAFHRTFSKGDGKIVLEHLEKVFGLEAAVFFPVSQGAHNGYCALTAAKTDGARGVLIYIKDKLNAPVKSDDEVNPEQAKVKK
jgi:hypothetical protein